MAHDDIRLKRAYDDVADNDGVRVLVDGMWPRGVRKKDAQIDHWLKTIAPSKSLRQWFGHDADKFAEFARRYKKELEQDNAAGALAQLRDYYRQGRVTLVYAARDTEHNNAVVLRDLLKKN